MVLGAIFLSCHQCGTIIISYKVKSTFYDFVQTSEKRVALRIIQNDL